MLLLFLLVTVSQCGSNGKSSWSEGGGRDRKLRTSKNRSAGGWGRGGGRIVIKKNKNRRRTGSPVHVEENRETFLDGS